MRTLEINKQPMWYALCTGKVEVIDEYGNHTGVFRVTYSDPVYFPVNMTECWGVRGSVSNDAYGIAATYYRTFITTDLSLPIKEDSIIWFGADPATEPHNYVVHQISNSLNALKVQIRSIGAEEEEPVVSG